MRSYSIIVFAFLCIGLHSAAQKLSPGVYRGVLVLNETTELPFIFNVKYEGKKPLILIHNADETIVVDEVVLKDDSVNFKMPVFDTEFRTRLVNGNLEGVWINHYRTTQNIIKFRGDFNVKDRFLPSPEDRYPFHPGNPNTSFEGKWETTFSPGKPDESKAVGVFHHLEQTDFVTGTFLTETGDYRYLDGLRNKNRLYLSCFDGSHAFLFTADYINGQIENGKFYSGSHWQEEWKAVKNEAFKLREADEIAKIIDANTKPDFKFPSLNNKTVSLSDKKYKNKAVILQVMGSWCPNCMDESIYYSKLYDQYKNQGLEIIAIAFEKADTITTAFKQVERMKTRLNMNYDIAITLKDGKNKASETFPMLDKVPAFPTSIFLNKKHQIVKVHTGFSGPATGAEYEKYKQSTESFIKNLIKE